VSSFIFLEEPNTYNLLKVAGSLLGFEHSAETLEIMRNTKSSENNPMFGKTHSDETKEKMSIAKSENKNASKMVYVYSFNPDTKEAILDKSFNSCTEVTEYFNCSTRTISNYLDKNKVYKDKLHKKLWILSSSLITKKE